MRSVVLGTPAATEKMRRSLAGPGRTAPSCCPQLLSNGLSPSLVTYLGLVNTLSIGRVGENRLQSASDVTPVVSMARLDFRILGSLQRLSGDIVLAPTGKTAERHFFFQCHCACTVLVQNGNNVKKMTSICTHLETCPRHS